MVPHEKVTAWKLDFETGGQMSRVSLNGFVKRPREFRRCHVCAQHRAHFMFTANDAHPPIELCQRCYHAVKQHRRMVKTDVRTLVSVQSKSSCELDRMPRRVSRDLDLIVPRNTEASAKMRDSTLEHSRRRAQVAARRALELVNCAD